MDKREEVAQLKGMFPKTIEDLTWRLLADNYGELSADRSRVILRIDKLYEYGKQAFETHADSRVQAALAPLRNAWPNPNFSAFENLRNIEYEAERFHEKAYDAIIHVNAFMERWAYHPKTGAFESARDFYGAELGGKLAHYLDVLIGLTPGKTWEQAVEEVRVTPTSRMRYFYFLCELDARRAALRDMERQRDELKQVFDSLHTSMSFWSGDWSEQSRLAWIYGVVVGWGNCAADIATKHGWDTVTLAKMQLLHDRVAKCEALAASPPVEGGEKS